MGRRAAAVVAAAGGGAGLAAAGAAALSPRVPPLLVAAPPQAAASANSATPSAASRPAAKGWLRRLRAALENPRGCPSTCCSPARPERSRPRNHASAGSLLARQDATQFG